jgi:hypothetical protein
MSSRTNVALWAGLSAFFSSLVSLKVFDLLLGNSDVRRILEATLVSVAVAGSMYTRQRLDEAKKERWYQEHQRSKGEDEPPSS